MVSHSVEAELRPRRNRFGFWAEKEERAVSLEALAAIGCFVSLLVIFRFFVASCVCVRVYTPVNQKRSLLADSTFGDFNFFFSVLDFYKSLRFFVCAFGFNLSTTASCVLQQTTPQCQGMETTFYEDSRGYRGAREDIMRGTKRPMTLDLNSSPKSKKPRGTALLSSPDLHMLKLESPELERLVIQQANQGQYMYSKAGNPYAMDFPDALGGLQQQQQQPSFNNLYQHHTPQSLQSDMGCGGLMPPMVDSYGYPQPPMTTSLNGNCNNNPMVSSTMVSSTSNCSYPASSMGGGNGYYSMDPSSMVSSIKEEPQTVPCASPPDPPTSPIDMEDQEKMKLERKRLRNRIAASKCRRRKLERIARLEDKVAHLKSENADLQSHVTRLKEHVCHLKQQVLDHVRSGCDMVVTNPSYNEEL